MAKHEERCPGKIRLIGKCRISIPIDFKLKT